jgi:hypothetical protein
MTGYWPWWLTAAALGGITVGYWIAVRRPLGVSGVLARFTRVREELDFDRGVAVVTDTDQAAIEAQLLAMTLEAFGPLQTATAAAPSALAEASPTAATPAPAHGLMEPTGRQAEEGRACAPVPSLGAHFTFLAMLVVGGLVAALLRGPVELQCTLGDACTRTVGGGALGLSVLAGGGLMVGFGTAMCGGCSAGHGLTGSARLFPGSLVSTLVFFLSAVVVAVGLSWRLA